MVLARSRRYLTDAARAFERAPVEVITGVVLAIAFSYAIEEGGDAFRVWTEVALAGALITVVAWIATLLHALGAWSTQRRWAVTGAGAAVVGVYAIFVMDFARSAEIWRAIMLVAGAVLLLVFAPALATGRGGSPTDRIREVDSRILLRTIGALLYAAALFIGLALALGAVNTLFELGMRSSIYAHVFGWIFLVLAPWIVIGGLPDYVRPADDSAVAGVAHRMTAYLVPPLLAIYCAILYAYVIRIGLTGEIPKNLLSPMVLAAGALGALSLFLFEPRPSARSEATADRADAIDAGVAGGAVGAGNAAGAASWLRAAPPLFLPLAVLGLWAVGLRVDQYGWTEFRLLRILLLATLGVLAAGGTVQLVRRRRFSLHVVPLVLCVALVAGAIGPWSVIDVSRRSQQAQLVAALRAVDVMPDMPLARPAPQPGDSLRTVPGELYQRINDTSRYLTQHHGADALPAVLAERAAGGASTYDLAQSIGLQRTWPGRGEESTFNGHFADGSVTVVRGMSAHRLTVSPDERGRATSGAITVRQDSSLLALFVDDRWITGDLGRYTSSLRPVPDRGGMIAGDEARISLTDSAGRNAGELLILHIGMGVTDGVLRLRHLDGLLFMDTPRVTTP